MDKDENAPPSKYLYIRKKEGNPQSASGTHDNEQCRSQDYNYSRQLDSSFRRDRNNSNAESASANHNKQPRKIGYNRNVGDDKWANTNNFQCHKNENNGYQQPRSGGTYREKRPFKMGFKAAQELVANEDVEMIIETLMNDRGGFNQTLKNDELSGDFLVLILQLLKKVSQTSFMSSKTNIFDMVFIGSSYLEQLRVFIFDLPDHQDADKKRNSLFWKDTDQFWHNLIEVFEETMKIPTLASQVLPKLLKGIIRTLPTLKEEQSITISDEIVEKFKIIQTAVERTETNIIAKYQQKQDSTNTSEDNEDNLVPPDDFRTIHIYPDAIEVTSRDRPFLRKNKIKGPYANVEHYLDIQFRLLREDFIAPLRRGICHFIDQPDKHRFDDIKIHKQIQFLKEEHINETKCFRIRFDLSNKKKTLNYEHSKQLMHGSLICFTKDRFLNIIFGRIVKKDADMIKNSELIVGFHEDVEISYTETYIMAESSVYFEPYYHVLNVLQEFQGDKFPLENYIIYAKSNVAYPEFITADTVYKIDDREIHPMHWPCNEKFYTFNESQQEAFKAALTHELSVIQGPPGTGKTFLGLKIVDTLLHNHQDWYKRSPILVICFTNHALDQFLEGIIQTTAKIVRVGSQSENKNLNEFNLNIKKMGKRSSNFLQLSKELRDVLHRLKSLDNKIAQLKKNNGIIQFRCFHFIPGFENTWYYRTSNKDIGNWLLGHGTENIINRYEHISIQQKAGPGSSHKQNRDDDEISEFSEHEEEVDELFTDFLLDEHRYIVSLPDLASQIDKIENTLKDTILEPDERPFASAHLFHLKEKHGYIKHMLDKFGQSRGKWSDINPKEMTTDQRWNLYRYCCTQYLDYLTKRRANIVSAYQQKYKLYSEARAMDDLMVLKENLVVGMTTTSAARLRTSLQALKCPIVIVEEAAEVLEAHITSALTTSCKQLILIGDHQQLKPKAANYVVEKEYNMGVSLFERLINNQVECHTLNVQHRMRPDICNLIRPAIYPDLQDHISVEGRPKIEGVEKHLFFLHHTQQEEVCGDTSKKNSHEAKFLISLARYLILNGYNPEKITILATYLGQMFEMQREKKKYSLMMDGVRISVLDNYQGEECDIILLSLVRNNKDNVNGFLKHENRVCVALSRARNGLYIMGNIEQLCQDDGTVWLKIKEILEKQNALGMHLELKCKIHNIITKVTTAEDFHKVSEGGCDRLCGEQLSCGHICKNVCHIPDRDHYKYNCLENCERTLCEKFQDHLCMDKCFMKCRPCHYPIEYDLKCGHQVTLECHIDVTTFKCIVRIPTVLPCGHSTDKPCHYSADEFPCPHPCETRVEPCGHACMLNCHIRDDPDHCQYKCKKPCTRIRTSCSTQEHFCENLCYEKCEVCTTIVQKQRTLCPHLYNLPCNENVDNLKCEKPCKRKLDCGHACKNLCFRPCGPCINEVEKIVPECGHEIKIMCRIIPNRQHCKQNCERTLECGHKCIDKCNKPCTTQCNEMKECNLLSPCHHIVTEIKCHLNLSSNDKGLLKYCTQPCDAILKCKHRCRGTCGECYQGRIHKRCMEECGVPLICNHLCPSPCQNACRPCEQNCLYKCQHSKCNKKCGDACVICKNKCPRRCRHQKCKNKCGQICSVKPCKKPCPKKLKCGHCCVGYCSEPCPRLCRICDRDKLSEIFFGTEDDEDARFVELRDCKHIFESKGLENWLSGDGEIQAKVCPRCNTSIVSTWRFSDYIKTALADINRVKFELNGSFTEDRELRQNLLRRINLMIKQKLVRLSGGITKFLLNLENRFIEVRSLAGVVVKQYCNKIILISLSMQIQILENILKICDPLSHPLPSEISLQLDMILNSLASNGEYLTEQIIEDIEMESFRLIRLVEIVQIRATSVTYTTLQSIQEKVLTYEKYSEKIDEQIKTQLRDLDCGIQINENQRMKINKPMGMAKGHWFKCPKGHPYYIEEDGGDILEANCSKCVKIGGTNHKFSTTNQLATEMDAAQAAGSEA